MADKLAILNPHWDDERIYQVYIIVDCFNISYSPAVQILLYSAVGAFLLSGEIVDVFIAFWFLLLFLLIVAL